MISRKTHRILAALALLLICLGCVSTQGEAMGSRSWLGYFRYGTDGSAEEKELNRRSVGVFVGESTCTNTVEAPHVIPPTGPISTPTEVQGPAGNALAELAGNKFDLPWTVSRVRLGSDRPAFKVGDKAKAKASPDGPTMTVEHVGPLLYVSAQLPSDISDSIFAIHYRCRWEKKDGSAAVGDFREDELEPVPAVDQD